MNTALVIYDLTGKIWAIYYGPTETPQGLNSITVDIPDGASLLRIDLSDPKNPKPVFSEHIDTDLDKVKKELEVTRKMLAEAVVELDGKIATLDETQAEQDSVLEFLLGIDEVDEEEE